MALSQLILGLILLGFGRQLFWLFVAIAGFLVGMEFGSVIFADPPQWVLLVVATCAGLVGALLAVIAERVAFALAGFLGGGYLTLLVAQSLGWTGASIVLFLVGGVIGGMLAGWIMDWAIIVLSCLVGAGAIIQALNLGQTVSAALFIVLVSGGAFFQSRFMTRSRAT